MDIQTLKNWHLGFCIIWQLFLVSALSSFKICMAAFLSLLQESVLTHAGIARTRWPRGQPDLHLRHSQVHPLTRRRRCRPPRSRSAAHSSEAGVPSIGAMGAPASDTTATSGRCCFHFSPPSSRAHAAPSHTSAPRSRVPGQAGAVFPESGRATSPAQAQERAQGGGKGPALGPR